MFRVIILALMLAVGTDHFFSGGKYTNAAQQISRSVLHNFRIA